MRAAVSSPLAGAGAVKVAAALVVAALVCLALAAGPAEAASASCPGWEPDMGKVKEMLMLLLDQMEALKIPHWCTYGTLLGIIREGRFINGDDDADTAIWDEDGPTLFNSKAAHKAFNDAGYQLVRSMNNDFKLYPIRAGCARKGDTDDYFPDCCENVDVFQFKRGSKCAIRGCFHKWKEPCPYPAGNDLALDNFPVDYVSSVIDYPGGGKAPLAFFGRQMPVPAHYNKFLAHVYGDDWRTPHKSKKYPTGGRKGCSEDDDDDE